MNTWRIFLSVILCVVSGFSQNVYARTTSTDQAKAAVRGWLETNSAKFGIKLHHQIRDAETIKDENGTDLYHVVYLHPCGYIIVSADDETEPIIALVPSGQKHDSSLQSPLAALLKTDVPGRITARSSAQETTLGNEGRCARRWATLIQSSFSQFPEGLVDALDLIPDVRVSPLLDIEGIKWDQSTVSVLIDPINNVWDQTNCYNYYTPYNYPCGCNATAMAQLMRYYKFPKSGVGTHWPGISIYIDYIPWLWQLRGGDGSGGPYDWDHMPAAPYNPSELERQAIGALTADAGVASHMNYTAGASGAGNTPSVVALREVFFYSNAIAKESLTDIPVSELRPMINPNLDARCPVLLGIHGTEGHEVVCDGYGYDDAGIMFHHFNMGHSGGDNCWYALPDMGDYSAIRGCGFNVFTNRTGEIISGRVTNSVTGVPIAGATITALYNGGSYTATTDNHGIYAFRGIPSSTWYTLWANQSAYSFPEAPIVQTGTSSDILGSLFAACGNVWGIDIAGTPQPLPAPSNLSAVPVSSSQINLTWQDNASNETGFKIERAASSSGPWTEIGTVGANVTSYPSTGLASCSAYYYRVRAYNGAGNSGYSNVAGATTLGCAPPNAPSSLGATAISSSQINLTWQDNASNETGFKIERAASTSGPWTEIGTVGANVTNYPSTGLGYCTAYYYRVRAYNGAGNSGYSNVAGATTSGCPSVPNAPSGLGSTAASSSQINLTWQDNSNNEQEFKIERSTDGVNFSQIATVGADVTSYPDTGLIQCTTYSYRVRAYNAVGNSGYSDISSAMTTCMFTYTIENNRVTITGYTGPGGDVTIPSMINGGTVTSIGDSAFYYRPSLTSIIIPNSVTNVGDRAFCYCTSLTNVTIGSSVTSIGGYAFAECTGLTSVMIPNSVTGLGDSAFYYCASLTNVTIGSSVTSIGGHVFAECAGLTSVMIPNSVTSIGGFAFSDCTSLTNVTIPNSVTSIGDYAFVYCSSLTSIAIPGSVTSIGEAAFFDCSSLVSVTVGNGVSTIGEDAFLSCTSLLSVTIPNSVTNIGAGAFEDCTSLASVTIGNGVTSIGDSTFFLCTSLMAITVDALNSSYSSLDGVLFNKTQTTLIQCPGGKAASYTIPNGVTGIGSFAFAHCTGLTSVTIPSSVTSIGSFAFEYCTGLTSVTIGSSVTSIGGWAFAACTGLKGVYFQGNAPSDIGGYIFAQDLEMGRPLNVTVYYLPGTTGWGATFGGCPTTCWNPQAQDLGVKSNQFGFTITGSSNLVIVVEACTDLTNPVWSPVGTNRLTGGSSYFSDPHWTNYPARFYRMRPAADQGVTDIDGDGIPDAWMQQYFGHPTGHASDHSMAGDDADGDGMSNLQEYLAGTDPTNNASAFRILSITRENNDLRVTWLAAGGHTNAVQAAPSLTGDYSDVSSNIVIAGSSDMATNYLDLGAVTNSPARYYRIRLVQ